MKDWKGPLPTSAPGKCDLSSASTSQGTEQDLLLASPSSTGYSRAGPQRRLWDFSSKASGSLLCSPCLWQEKSDGTKSGWWNPLGKVAPAHLLVSSLRSRSVAVSQDLTQYGPCPYSGTLELARKYQAVPGARLRE